jgi:tetratricopeptide (TPR) repeat protein
MAPPRRLLCLLLAWTGGFGLTALAVTKEQSMDPEVRVFYNEGNAAYYGRHDRDEAMRLYKELEAISIRKENHYWLGTAYWKQAQVLSGEGNQAGSIALFEKSLVAFNRDSDFAGTANHVMLLRNLFTNYENRGQRGESLRIHQALIHATGLNLNRSSKLPVDTPLFELSDEQLAGVKNMAFIGFLYLTEIELRFKSGNDSDALALAQKLDRRFAGTQHPREITVYAAILEMLAKIHLAAGRTAEAEAVLRRILPFSEVPKTEAYDEVLGSRINLALLRCRLGDAPAPWIDYARKAIEETTTHRWTHRRLSGTGKLARMLALAGNTAAGFDTINAAIAEARNVDEPVVLADLLLTRAELRLDAGSSEGVQADLFETLKWYRQQGGLRAEASAFVQYVRLLRLNGTPSAVHLALNRAEACLRRFPDARQAAFLSTQPPAVTISPAKPVPPVPPSVRPSIGDLQPIELTTQVSNQWSAKGRFTLTNPEKALVEGLMQARGIGLIASWDEARLLWEIRADAKGTPNQVEQRIALKPYDQAIIALTVDSTAAGDGRIQLTWRDEGDEQSAWWRFSQGRDPNDLAVIDANLALENPFYSVPLHHYVVRPNADAGTSQNLRVITSAPCRVELVEAATGKVLAVDATGDGDFKGVGDVIFADGNLDGSPDLRLDKNQRVAEVEIQVYPLSANTEVGVNLELQKSDGTWVLSATDRLLGKQ